MSAFYDMQPFQPATLREESDWFEAHDAAMRDISVGGGSAPFESSNRYEWIGDLSHDELDELQGLFDRTLLTEPGDAYEALGRRVAAWSFRWAWKDARGGGW